MKRLPRLAAMAKSRHHKPEHLRRYVKPSPQADSISGGLTQMANTRTRPHAELVAA